MASRQHVTNGVLQERIAQMDERFTARDEESRMRLAKIEQLLQEMREQQIEDAQSHKMILSKIDGVADVVNEHNRILVGENHGMNKPGLVAIVKGHDSEIGELKKDVDEVKKVIHAPEKKFWNVMGKILDTVTVTIVLMLLAILTHKLGL